MSRSTFSSLLDSYNVIMAVNLTTLKIKISFYNMEFSCISPVLIPPLKMSKPSVLCVLLMTSFALCLFNILCFRSSGLRPSTRPHIYSIFVHPKLTHKLLTSLYFSLIQITPTFASSVVSVSQTPTPLLLTNFPRALPRVSI